MTVVSIHPGVTREQIQEQYRLDGALRRKGRRDAAADATRARGAARPAGAHRPRAWRGGVMASRDAFICDAVRTPIGRYGGALAKVRTDDLAAVPIKALMARNPKVDWEKLDEVYFGCANQAGEDNRNVARMALLLAGLPDSVPGVTLNRLCASGLEAVGTAARAIRAGEMEFAIAGGVESMTRAPFVRARRDEAFSREAEIYDTTIGWRFINPLMKSQYGVDSMPETGENVAEEFQVTRADQDAFALRSQQRAAQGDRGRLFRRGDRAGRDRRPARRTGHGRHRTSIRARHHARATRQARSRSCAIRGTVTAGNASGVNDGAAALIVASEAAVKAHGLTPLARILGMASAGVPPRIMGIGPVPATRKLMARLGLKIGRFRRDRAQRGLRLAGARLLRQLGACRRCRARQPERRRHRARPSARHVGRAPRADRGASARQEHGGKRALATMCVGVGQGVSLALERV